MPCMSRVGKVDRKPASPFSTSGRTVMASLRAQGIQEVEEGTEAP